METHVAIRACRRLRSMRSHLKRGLKVAVGAEAVKLLLLLSSNPPFMSTLRMPFLATAIASTCASPHLRVRHTCSCECTL